MRRAPKLVQITYIQVIRMTREQVIVEIKEDNKYGVNKDMAEYTEADEGSNKTIEPLQVVDPSQSRAFAINVIALLPYMLQNYEDDNPLCIQAAENIAQVLPRLMKI